MIRKVTLLLVLVFCCDRADGGFVVLSTATTTTTPGVATTVGGFSNGTNTFQNEVRQITSFGNGTTNYNSEYGFNRLATELWSSASVSKMYYFTGGTPISGTSYTGSYAASFSDLFDTPFRINVGSDNVLAETYDSLKMWNTNQIQIANNDGLTKAGISIIERGANDTNFRVRLITSLDEFDNPDGYSDWYEVTTADPFGSGLTIDGDSSAIAYDIYQDTSSPYDGEFLQFHQSNSQNMGGVLITFDEFGQVVGDSLYGYEIAVRESGSRTGLDLIPGGGIAQQQGVNGLSNLTAIPEPSTYAMMAVAGVGFFLYRRWNREATA